MQEVKEAVRVTFRLVAMVIGLIGTILALITNIAYSTGSRIIFINGNGHNGTTSHGWWGLLVVLVALIGSIAAFFRPAVGAFLMVVAAVAFFFIVNGFAVVASVVLIIAAIVAFLDRKSVAAK